MSQEPLILKPLEDHKATIIFLHGLGDSGYGWKDVFEIVQQHIKCAKVILPHAPVQSVTINFGMKMPSWFDIQSLDQNSPNTFDGIDNTKEYIESLIKSEIDNGLDSTRIILAGFSQGGACSIYTGYQTKYKLGGVICLSGFLCLASKFVQNVSEENKNTPLLMCHGLQDQVVPFSWGKKSFEVLESLKIPAKLNTYEGMAHSSSEKEINDVIAFIKQCLSI